MISSSDNTSIASKGENSDFLYEKKYHGNSLEGGTLPLTRARPGGGAVIRRRSGFSHIAKRTAARSATKFAIAVQPTIWHIFKKRWPDDTKGDASRSH